jgi:Ca-activated chloride channel family protein
MTQDTNLINLTRRQMLAGVGAVGLASAGAGLGTSALFSDREEFQNNQFVAGELDLKVDWQQRYYFGADGQAENDPSTWAPYPPGSDSSTYPAAFPDNGTYDDEGNFVSSDLDGLQDPIFSRLYIAENPTQFDLGSEPTTGEIETVYRSQFDDRSESDQPIITVPDVKPGDCGELTLSMHLFDNPGYIWLGGELLENAENGVSDAELHDIPEGAEDDGLGSESGTSMSGELADLIDVELFYDTDCDNQFDEASKPCVVFAIDTSESMLQLANQSDAKTKIQGVADGLRQLLDDIDALDGADGSLPFEVGLELFPGIDTSGNNGPADLTEVALTTDYSSNSTLDDAVAELENLSATEVAGSTQQEDLSEAITASADQLATCPDDTTERVMVVITNGLGLTDGSAELAAEAALTADKLDEYVTLGVATSSSQADTTLQQIAELTPPADYFDANSGGEAESIITDGTTGIASIVSSLEVGGDGLIFEGSLAELFAGDGDGWAGLQTPAGLLMDGNFETAELDCFDPMGRYCIAMKWCLPLEVGNEVQSDSVSFDIDLYTEQCRNNSDPASRTPFAESA